MGKLHQQFKKVSRGDYGVIGDPISHSLSPCMQQAALKKWWKSLRRNPKECPIYHRLHVRPAELGHALQLARHAGMRGLNVTVPHKEAVVRYVRKMDRSARSSGSINTLLFKGKIIQGFSTDGEGFEKSLQQDLKFRIKGKKVLVLGAGGTAKVIVNTLQKRGAKEIFWWNRTGKKIDQWLKTNRRTAIKNVSFHSELNKMGLQADLIVNTTSVGLKSSDGLPAPALGFRKGQAVFDVIYHRTTPLLKKAKQRKARVTDGLGMLLYQGAASFKIWTGKQPDIALMRKALKQNL